MISRKIQIVAILAFVFAAAFAADGLRSVSASGIEALSAFMATSPTLGANDRSNRRPLVCVPPPANAVSWYRAENDANDATGTNHGTLTGGLGFTTGMVGQGLLFDVVNKQLVVHASASTNVGSGGEITAEAWLSPFNAGTVRGTIIEWPRGAVSLDRFNGFSDRRLILTLHGTNGANVEVVSDANAYSDGVFQHVAFTYSSTTGQAIIYVNGTAVKTENVGNFIPTTTGDINIGNHIEGSGQKPFFGTIDEVAIYNRALSQAEIQTIVNASSSGKCVPTCTPPPSGNVAWWKGENNAFDSIGLNNGTLSGSSSFVTGKSGQGFQFGPGGKMTVPGSGSLNVSGDQITIEAWVKLENNAIHPAQDFSAYIGKADFPLHQDYAILFESGLIANSQSGPQLPANQWQVEYIFTNSTGTRVHNQHTGVFVTVDGNYHHFAVTYKGSDPVAGNVKIYVDGVLQNTNISLSQDQMSGNLQQTLAEPVMIGASGATSSASIDEAAIYSTALSPNDVQAIVASGTAGKCLSCATPPANLVSSWKGENNADDSTGSHNGMLQNGVTFTTGEVGQAFNFDGVDDFIDVPDSPSLDAWSTTASFEGWINPQLQTAVNGDGFIFARRTPFLFEGFRVTAENNGSGVNIDLCVGADGGNVDCFTTTGGIVPLDQWTHIAATVNLATNTKKIYINGLSQTLTTFVGDGVLGSNFNNADSLFIGKRENSVGFFKGAIDEPTFYFSELSQSQIQSIFNAGSVGKCLTSPLAISPTTANINLGATQTFSATGGTGPYTFSIVGTPKGSIDQSTGVYTAIGLGTDTVRVTDAANATSEATVNVTAACVPGQKTWDGGGSTNNWSEAANWSCDAVPTASETVIFDETSTKNATIDVNIGVRNMQINSGYTGTISQGSSTIAIGGFQSASFTQNAGTFNAGSGAITVDLNGSLTVNGGVFNGSTGPITVSNSALLVNGGTFNAPTGTLTFEGSTNNQSLSINGGTFNANNGTAVFRQASASCCAGIDIAGASAGSADFFNVEFANTASGSNVAVGDTMRVNGMLNLTDGNLSGNGVVEALGDVNISSTWGNGTDNTGNTTLRFAGSQPGRTVTIPSGIVGNLNPIEVNSATTTITTSGTGVLTLQQFVLLAGTINTGTADFRTVPSNGFAISGGNLVCGTGTVSIGSGTLTQTGGNFDCSAASALNLDFLVYDLIGGAFTAPAATLNLNGGNFNRNGGTFLHNGGTTVVGSYNGIFGSRCCVDFNFGGASAGTETFFNVELNNQAGLNASIATGDRLIVAGDLTMTNGTINGAATSTLEARGNVTVAPTWDASPSGNDPVMLFGGSANQTFTNNGGPNLAQTWTIDKPAGTVTAASDLILAPTQPLNITSGTLYLNDGSDLTSGAITIGANGRLVNESSTTITLGGNLTNAGIVDLQGGGAVCPENDTILIRSSSTTQRSWNGNGAFRLVDVDVQRMGGVPPKTVFSGTNSGSNNGTWTFDAGCPAAVSITPTIAGVQTGQTQAFAAGGAFSPFTFSLAVNNSGGSIDSSNGVYTAGATPGVTDTVRVTDRFGGTADATVSTFGVASKLGFIDQPLSTTAGQNLTPITVAVQDAGGNTVTSSNSAVTISFSNNAGGGTMSGTLTRNAINGIATFNDISIDRAGTGYALFASSGALTSATSNAFNIAVGSPAKLAFTVQPSNAIAGANILPNVKVAVQDAAGNVVTTASNPITLAIGNNPSGGTLFGVGSPTTINGVATFPNLVIDNAGDGYTLIASSGSLTAATSATFNITSPFVVTNTNDSGAGSLRQAIINSNSTPGIQTISFNIAGAAPFSIAIDSNLPTVSDSIIDGTTQPGFSGAPVVELTKSTGSTATVGLLIISSSVKGLIINRFGEGISGGGTGSVIQGNYIGTNAAGTAALPNGVGIRVGGNNIQIGGSSASERNVISGNSTGITINSGTSAVPLIIKGNFIGTNAAGTGAVPNTGLGIFVNNSQNPVVIGGPNQSDANLIAFNGSVGVSVGSTRVTLLRNSIHSNGGMAFDIGFNGVTRNDSLDGDVLGSNQVQNFPVLSSATSFVGSTIISGSLSSKPSQVFTLEFFSSAACDASGFGEGETFVGSTTVTTDAGGIAPLNVTFPVTTVLGRLITATATDANGNTSEFSQCKSVAAATFEISGHVTDPNGNPLAGVTVSNQATRGSKVTDANGFYKFINMPGSLNTSISARRTNTTFVPSSRTITNLSSNQTTQDFVGTTTANIQGKIQSVSGGVLFPLSGVSVALSGPVSQSTQTDNNGNYKFISIPTGNYTVTPTRQDFNFSPVSSSISLGPVNQTVDFTGQASNAIGRIYFDNAGGIGMINPDGSGKFKFSPALPGNRMDVSSDGRKIVYVFSPASGPIVLKTANSDGSNPVDLTSVRTGSFQPAWSPLGDKVAFINSTRGIDVINSNGTGQTTIASAFGGCLPTQDLDWSAIGDKLVFDCQTPGTGSEDIYSINANGTGLTRLTTNGGTLPAVSPDGSKIAFFRGDDLYLMNLDGSGQTPLFSPGAVSLNRVRWSPDGNFLMFRKNVANTATVVTLELSTNIVGTVTTTDILLNFVWAKNADAVTPSGSNVTVQAGAATVNFGSVAASGTTTITPIAPAFAGVSPDGFVLGNQAYEIFTSANITPPITVCMTVPSTTTLTQFNQLNIMHNESGVLVNRTTSRNFATKQICAQTTSLSPFVLAEQIDAGLSAITGVVQDSNGDPMSGVAMTLTGSEDKSTQTDSDGRFSFVNLPNGGNYNVSPKQVGYLFDEYNTTVTGLNGEETVFFEGTQRSFEISGQVTDGSGSPLSGVTLVLDGAANATVTSDASGNYTFAGLPADGKFTVSAANGVDVFSPASADVDPLTGDWAGVDFQASFAPTAADSTVNGRVTTADGRGIRGTVITLTDTAGNSRTAISTTFGYYQFDNVPSGATYIISIASKRFVFTPSSRVISVSEDVVGADFVSTGQ